MQSVHNIPTLIAGPQDENGWYEIVNSKIRIEGKHVKEREKERDIKIYIFLK